MLCRLQPLLFERKFLKPCPQLLSLTLPNGKRDGAIVIEMLVDDTRLHLLYNTHHTIHHRISELISDLLFNQPLLNDSMCDSISRCSAISHDKTTCTKVYASVVTDDTDKNVRQIVAVDLSKDRLTCC